MGLPVIKHPTFELTIPSTKQKIKYRPFLVKEEKILLLAQSTENIKDIISAIKQILNNCILEGDVDLNNLPSFDVEYMFLQLRANSVNSTAELKFTDPDTEEEHKTKVDLSEVNVQFVEGSSNIVDIGNGISMVMKWPTYSDIGSIDFEKDAAAGTVEMIKICTTQILSGENQEQVDQFKDYTNEEVDEFIDSLPPESFTKFQKFFTDMPKLEHTIEYEVGKKKKTHTFSGIQDFFSFA